MGSWWSSEVAMGGLFVAGVVAVVLLETALERRIGEGSRAQSIFAALVIAGIVGFFGWRYMRDAKDAGGLYVGTPVRRWAVEGGQAILYKKPRRGCAGRGSRGRAMTRRMYGSWSCGARGRSRAAWSLIGGEVGRWMAGS